MAIKKKLQKSEESVQERKGTQEQGQDKKVTNPKLLKIVEDINKKFGEGAITLGLPSTSKKVIQRIKTGSLSLDIDTGGGIPIGRITEISGGFSSGKSTQIMHIIRNAQEQYGFISVILDAEGTYDEDYFKALKVNPQMCYYSEPSSLEEGTQLILDLQRNGAVQLAVIDSIAAMSPNKVQASDMDESVQLGLAPKLWGEFLSKFQMNNNMLERNGMTPVTLIGANQLRERIGAYGDPEYTTGGRAWGFYKSVDIRFRKGDWITQGKGDNREIVGQVTKYKIEKNKTYKRMRVGEFDFYFTDNLRGVPTFYNDTAKEIILLAIEYNIISKGGSWFKYKDQKYQGAENLISAIMNDEGLMQELTEQIKKVIITP